MTKRRKKDRKNEVTEKEKEKNPSGKQDKKLKTKARGRSEQCTVLAMMSVEEAMTLVFEINVCIWWWNGHIFYLKERKLPAKTFFKTVLESDLVCVLYPI